MLLAVDVGNSNISFGLFNISAASVPELLFSSRISSSFRRSPDEYTVLIDQILKFNGFNISDVSCSAISSVVPHLTEDLTCALGIISESRPFVIAPGIKTGFQIVTDDPAILGSDIVANVAGALTLSNPPLVVLDAGTADTLTFVDSSNRLQGTVISPGLRISSEALSTNAELIEKITIKDNIPLIGKNTEESINSGLVLGNALMFDGFVRNIRENYLDRDSGEKLSLIATGGFCELITRHTRNKFKIEKNLTLYGTAVLYVKNCLK